MKKLITLLTCLLIVSGNLLAQYSTDWIRPAENSLKTGVMMARDNADNVIVTGKITSNNIYTRKYDKFGNFQWEKFSTSGIQSNYEKPYWINTDNNNNVFVTGCRYVGTSQQYPDALVVLKYSPEGALLWKNTIPMTIFVNSFTSFNVKSEVDSNGNLYIGTVAVTPSGFVLLKLDPNGTILFTSSNNLNGVTMFRSMRLKGNKVVMCGSSGNLSAAPVVAWDTTGNLLYTGSFLGQSGNDVEIDDAGNTYLLTSYANQVNPSSGQDIMIYKINPAGTQLWVQNFDFAGYDYPTRFTFVADKLSVIGYGSINAAYFDWITFQINTSGTLLWYTRYNETSGNDEQPYFIAAKANGEVFVTGKGGPMFTQFGSSYLRMITLKYNNTGVRKWVDSVNIYSGWGLACTVASDSSLFVLSDRYMTAFHFLDHSGTGTCNIPTGLNVSNIANTYATFSWTPVSGATLYHLRYKTTTANTWTVVSFNLPSINIYGLYSGTSYNYAVEAVCSNGPSGYSATQTFTTTGTGICSSAGQSQVLEYLSQLWIGSTVINNSGRDNGYGDFTNVIVPLTQGQPVNGYLSGLVPFPEYENYGIWIDYNHDNDFTDAGEQVVTLYSDFTGLIAFNFTVPASAPLGPTRMRVIMDHDNPALPCGVYARGETEDYTVLINDNSIVPPAIPTGINAFNITNSSASFSWTPDNSAYEYHLRYKPVTATAWTVASVHVPSFTAMGLAPNTNYNYSCESVGSGGPSGYSATQTFTTGTVLPIHGIEIMAKRQGANVLISWSTQSEQNSAYFNVERSYDGIAFTAIGQVQAAGFSNNIRNYQFTDVNAAKSMIFYRLKMTDADAGYKLSPVRVVAKSDGVVKQFLLYPNPATSHINIVLNEAANEDLLLQIVNPMGQIVKNVRIVFGTQVFRLDVNELPEGIYVLRLTGMEGVQSAKLIIW
jgi:hypothetical protein